MNDSQQTFQAGRRIDSQPDEQVEATLAPAKIITQGQSEYIEEPEDELLDEEIDLEPVYKKSKWQTLKGVFAVSFLVLVLLEFAYSLVFAFQQSVILGGVYLTAVVSGVLLIGRMLWREYRMLRSLKRNQLHRQEADRLLNSEQVGGALPWLEKLNKHQQLDNFEAFKNQVATHHSDKEIMTLYAK
ncbi:hypothetical protein P4S68_22235 [Pseudoalteromonas sp. Hal099]